MCGEGMPWRSKKRVSLWRVHTARNGRLKCEVHFLEMDWNQSKFCRNSEEGGNGERNAGSKKAEICVQLKNSCAWGNGYRLRWGLIMRTYVVVAFQWIIPGGTRVVISTFVQKGHTDTVDLILIVIQSGWFGGPLADHGGPRWWWPIRMILGPLA